MCKGIDSGIRRPEKEKHSRKRDALRVFCSVVVLVFAAVVLPTKNAPKVKDTFMKRCLAHGEQQKICLRMWTTFEQAYVGKDDSEEKSYDKLFADMPFKHPCDKTMLWSGTKDMVHSFTNDSGSFFTLEDTLLGHVLDELKWCGKRGSTETFTQCDHKNPKAVKSFWETASMKFAQYACDEVTVMLDGTKPQPFPAERTFGKIEVPHLQPSKVKQLTIVLITESNSGQCNKKSVKDLEDKVKSMKILSACKEVTKSHIEECIRGKNYKSCW